MTTFEKLGKVVVEADGGALVVMFPDGTVKAFSDAKRVERAAKKWFEEHTETASVGEIEWPADRWPGRPASLLGEVKFRKHAA